MVPVTMASLVLLLVASTPAARAVAIRVWPLAPSPSNHPLRDKRWTPGVAMKVGDAPPPMKIRRRYFSCHSRKLCCAGQVMSPVPGRELPGWAALRLKATDLNDLDAAWAHVDLYLGNGSGQFDCGSTGKFSLCCVCVGRALEGCRHRRP